MENKKAATDSPFGERSVTAFGLLLVVKGVSTADWLPAIF
jgi:hypothetical protein